MVLVLVLALQARPLYEVIAEEKRLGQVIPVPADYH
jgi:hypothetical protein